MRVRFRLCLLPLLFGLAPSVSTTARENTAALALRQALSEGGPGDPVFDFYAMRGFAPAWSAATAAQAQAVLARAGEQGLRAEDYADAAAREPDAPAAGTADYDLALTVDVLRYANDVRMGRVQPIRVYKDVSLPRQSFDAGMALNQALRDRKLGAFFASLPPPHPEYAALVLALGNYRALAVQGGWPVIPGKGEVALNGNGPRTRALALRLALEDPGLAGALQPTPDDIRAALMRFQTRNGMAPDGRAGAQTLAALNVPAATRIGQIIANMERWRWMPRRFEDRYIVVNVPEQDVQYVAGDTVLLSTRAIVGKLATRTPILRTTAESLVVNPPWHVPDDIATAQILPKLRQNRNYLAARNMTLINGPASDPQGLKLNWRRIKTMPWYIDQAPGADSAMGVLMLDSPNDFDVYLHDTPGKALFKMPLRLRSNGCVRVEAMTTLASLALTGDSQTAIAPLQQIIEGRLTQRIALDRPLPVYLLYWTAVGDDSGMVGFRPDLYRRDAVLAAALAAPKVDQSPIVQSPAVPPQYAVKGGSDANLSSLRHVDVAGGGSARR